MPFYPLEYLADTAHLTTREHGAYMLLIMNYWARQGPLPGDDKRLSAICRMTFQEWLAVKETIEEFFDAKCDGKADAMRWHHGRIDTEIKKWISKSWKARASAKARWDKDNNAVALQTQYERNARRGEDIVKKLKKEPSVLKKEALAKRLPDTWWPSNELFEKVRDKTGIVKPDIEQIAMNFKLYWQSEGGQKSRKMDWDKAFQVWCNREGKSNHNGAGKTGFGETAKAMIDEGRNLEVVVDAPEQQALPSPKRL